MSNTEKLSIALTRELAKKVREAVDEGDYASSSEVIRDALRAWMLKRDQRAAAIDRIRELWNEGIASGEPEERQPLDEFLADLRNGMPTKSVA